MGNQVGWLDRDSQCVPKELVGLVEGGGLPMV